MAGLLEHGRYPGVFFADRLAAVPTAPFRGRWWYREALDLHPAPGQHTFLTMNGVLSRAEPLGQRAQGRRRLRAAGRLLPLRVRHHHASCATGATPSPSTSRRTTRATTASSPSAWSTGTRRRPTAGRACSSRPTWPRTGRSRCATPTSPSATRPGLTRADLTVQTRLRNNSGQAQVATLNGVLTGPNTEIRLHPDRPRAGARDPPGLDRALGRARSCACATRPSGGPTRWARSRSTGCSSRRDVAGARSDTASAERRHPHRLAHASRPS